MSVLAGCISKTLELRKGMIGIINLYIERRDGCKDIIAKGDALYNRYNHLRIGYKIILSIINGETVLDGDAIASLIELNMELKKQAKTIEHRLAKCKASTKKIEVGIDVMGLKINVMKKGEQTAAQDLKNELETIEDEMDLDYYQLELINLPKFTSVEACEADVEEMRKLQTKLVKEYTTLDAECEAKLTSISELEDRYRELDSHCTDLLKKAEMEDDGIYKLLLESETLRGSIQSKTKALKVCDDNIREINEKYAVLAGEYNSWSAKTAAERKARVGDLTESLEDLKMAVGKSHKRVTIDPGAKKTSEHKLFIKSTPRSKK